MNEENMNAVNEEVTMPGANGDEWDDIDLSGLVDEDYTSDEADGSDGDSGADQPAEVEAPETEEAAAEETPAAGTEDEAKPAEGGNADEQFTLKHLGESKNYSRDEMTALAQKGLDYDRIRTERDSMKAEMPAMRDAMSFLKELADNSNVSVDEFMEGIRAKVLIAREAEAGRTISDTGAREQIRREKAARERDAAETVKANGAEADTTAAQTAPPKPDVTAEIRRFAQTYPEVKATEIPQKVWDDFRAGKGDLTSLYTMTENAALRQKVAALEQNEKNRGRSTGSMKSAGNRPAKSAMQEVWDAYDD